MTGELLKTVNGEKQTSYEYSRYWHGYIIFLRILLVFFDINAIRLITQITLLILIGILMYFVKKNSNWKLALIIFISFVVTDLFSWPLTLQGMAVMIIAVIGAIFIANKKVDEKNINLWIFIIGCLTAYFDLLSTPLITFLIPATIYSIVNFKETTYKKEIIRYIQMIIAWGVGFLSLWAVKWIIVDLFYDGQIFLLSLLQIWYRIGGIVTHNVENLGLNAIAINIANSSNFLTIVCYILLYVYALANVRKFKLGYFINSEKTCYILTAITPIIWYFFIAEHSFQHYFFAYKLLLSTFLSICLIVLDDRNGNYINIEKRKNIIKTNGEEK